MSAKKPLRNVLADGFSARRTTRAWTGTSLAMHGTG
jgi:hypothetical protein